MNEKKDQNNEVEVTTAEQIPQESKQKKEFCLVRAGKWANRKYLQFKAKPIAKWIIRGVKVTEGVLAIKGLKSIIDKHSVEPEEAVITCGEISDEPETQQDEESAELIKIEEANEEHD